MVGRDHLHHRRHADRVAAGHAEEAALGRAFQLGAVQAAIDAVPERRAGAGGRSDRQRAQIGVVEPRLVGEAQADRLVVRADQRRAAGEVQMVLDQHHVARGIVAVEAAGRVGNDEGAGAEPLQHVDGERDVARLPALVEVQPSLHHDRAAAEQVADHELALVAGRGGDRKALDLGIGDDCRVLHRRSEMAEAGAEHECRLARRADAAGDRAVGPVETGDLAFGHLCVPVVHVRRSSP